MKKLQRARNFIKRKVQEGVQILQDESGLSVIEMLLILVGKFTPHYRGCIKCIESKHVDKLD